ncbi:hypothetical protein H6F42_11410 [Pseudanabaena sp. FACHB-1998]|uniref:hypothetical protein n=1 Tax=Pseudanabaena sp. FACHB-1998 TaxID=2692858 RepID=UPI0016814B0B|nr:hypothetical protein [Pseudanabaena sp. FACHB-1998]MBD2177520.1 hypothetical protein [Pseudanabaena sp. FACHB-1998]
MALKIGKLELGYRLLISLTGIAIAYGWLGAYLCSLLRYGNYLNSGLIFGLAVGAAVAIPASLGGLLAAIAAIAIVYWKAQLTASIITAIACLIIYVIGFQDVRYEPETDKKLSILEIIATLITITFTAIVSFLVLQPPSSWLTYAAIGAIAGSITLVGKQLLYTDLPKKTIWGLLGIVAFSSLAIGLAVRAILYLVTRPTELF